MDHAALDLALRKLRTADRFESEMRGFLADAGHDEGVADEVVAHLKGRKILDDERTIKSLIERRSGRRSVGDEKLRAELLARGAPEEMVGEALAASEEGETERMQEALKGKFGPGDSRAKGARFLSSRGFSEEAIESALDRFFGTSERPD